jgi:hypothetical protein
VTLKLTCDSAGAHLEVRLAWRRHCRAGEAKVRAANMLDVWNNSCYPIGATGNVVAVRRGGRGLKSGRCAKLKNQSSAAGLFAAKVAPSFLRHAPIAFTHQIEDCTNTPRSLPTAADVTHVKRTRFKIRPLMAVLRYLCTKPKVASMPHLERPNWYN